MSRFPEFDRSLLRDAVRPRSTDLAFAAEKANFASEFYRRLVEWINNFDSTLDQEHEVGVRLVSFGQTVVFHLDDMSYWNPSLISFQGITEDGEPVELIQHVSQISILLMKLKRPDPTKPKKKLGFIAEKDKTENPSTTED